MLGNPNKAFSQVFAVDFKVVNTDNNTTRLALGSYGDDGFKYSQPAILFWFIPDGGGLKQLTLRTEEITQSRTLKLPDKSGTLTTNTTDMQYMFSGCNSLTSIKVGDKFKWANKISAVGLKGTWKDETGTRYTSDDTFPSNVAHTYTKVS